MAERVPTFRGQGNDRFATDHADQTVSRGQTVPYDINGAPTGAAVADGDYGDIVVTGSGHAWAFDPAVVTAFSRTVLDDANAAAWGITLGLQALAYKATINNADWSGADLDITNGGTGASSAAAARSNLSIIASNIPSVATGDVAATDVQGAIAELASEKLASTSYTAADVLAKLITVDGSGSGLDADTLRGTPPTAFGLSQIDDANAAAGRTTLGLGTSAVKDIGITGNVVAVLDGARATVSEGWDFAGMLRGTGLVGVPTSGTGWELYYSGGTFFKSGTRSGGGALTLTAVTIDSSQFNLQTGGANRQVVTNTGTQFSTHPTTASAANAFIDTVDNNYLKRSTSSLAFKRDVEAIEPQYVEAALKLRPVWYRSKAERDRSDWGWWGLIAEEVAEIDPRLVHWGYGPEAYDRRFKNRAVLRKRAALKPDGVQYERLAVLLLSWAQRAEPRLRAIEAAIQGQALGG
jgi:hypothetical protein